MPDDHHNALGMSANPETLDCDLLIVGAGPAGLFAALSHIAAGITNVTVVDAGPDIGDRRRASDLSREVGWGHPDYERGIGGAGLFSDGKLCLSLDVGGHLEGSPDVEGRALLLAQITNVFRELIQGPFAERSGDTTSLETLSEEAHAKGLRFKHYPVAHIGTERCGDVIVLLRALLAEAGVSFLPRTQLEDLRVDRASGDKIALVRREGIATEIRARKAVLAMGKVGAREQADLCRRVGLQTRSQPIYVGVRFEADAERLEDLFAMTKDPKYSAVLPDGSRVKTHCASERGEVIELSYSGLPLAGGHNYTHAQTSRSGFSILWDGFDHHGAPYDLAAGIMRRASEASGGGLLVQRIADYRAGRKSTSADLAGLELSCRTAVGGDIRSVLPPSFFEAMDLLLERLERLIPGIVDETAVVYAPAIEWWMERIVVDENFTSDVVPGFAVCGDGSGWSQGIVHAAATGLLAAAGLHGQETDVAGWLTAASRDRGASRRVAV